MGHILIKPNYLFNRFFNNCINILGLPAKTAAMAIHPCYFLYVYSILRSMFFCTWCYLFLWNKKNQKPLIFLSLFFISMSRSIAVLLIPSFFIMHLFTCEIKNWKSRLVDFICIYSLPLALGLVTFCWYQYFTMGVWNAYFYQQTNFWGHKFSMPKFPLSNPYSGFKILWLNALSLFTGLIGGFYLVKNAYSILYSKKRATDKLMVLSAAYLVLIVTINLFFSPQWGTGTTNIEVV